MYFPTLDTATGGLVRFELTPLRIRRFRLERPPDDDTLWLLGVLNRESQELGVQVLVEGEWDRFSVHWQ
jgi:poly-gamma-glutamate synthesis protein (capsule biosynthesis protein)